MSGCQTCVTKFGSSYEWPGTTCELSFQNKNPKWQLICVPTRHMSNHLKKKGKCPLMWAAWRLTCMCFSLWPPTTSCLLPLVSGLRHLASCHVPLASCHVPLASCLLRLASCVLPMVYCLSPLASCLLLIASGLVPLATCLVYFALWTLWAEDRLCCYGSSMYMVTLLGRYTFLWLVYLYNVNSYSVVHIITISYKIYI